MRIQQNGIRQQLFRFCFIVDIDYVIWTMTLLGSSKDFLFTVFCDSSVPGVTAFIPFIVVIFYQRKRSNMICTAYIVNLTEEP